MRATSKYRGWTIDILSRLHKHFAKGATFSASASMSKTMGFAEHGAGGGRGGQTETKTMSAASEGGHCTVDFAEADVLARAHAAIDRREASPGPNRTPPTTKPV